MAVKNVIVVAAVATSIQGLVLMLFSALSLAQYYCVIDFLQNVSLLTYIKVVYFFNPSCGRTIIIGNAIDGIPDQAFIMITNEPLPTTRMFYINCINLAMSVLSIIASAFLMVYAGNGVLVNTVRRLWTAITICSCIIDIIITISLINDTFYLSKVDSIMMYLNARFYGIGNTDIDLSWGAWVMVILFSRIGVLLFLNIALLYIVSFWANLPTADPERVLRPPTPSFEDNEYLSTDDDLYSASQLTPYSAKRNFQSSLKSLAKPTLKSSDRMGKLDFELKKIVHFPDTLVSVPQTLGNNRTCLQVNKALGHPTVDSTVSKASHSAHLQTKSQGKFGGNVKEATLEDTKETAKMVFKDKNKACLPVLPPEVPQSFEKIRAELSKEKKPVYATIESIERRPLQYTDLQAKIQPKVGSNVDQSRPVCTKELEDMDIKNENKGHSLRTPPAMHRILMAKLMVELNQKFNDDGLYMTMKPAKIQPNVSSNVHRAIPESTKESKELSFVEELVLLRKRMEKLTANLDEEPIVNTKKPAKLCASQSTEFQAKNQPKVIGYVDKAIPERTKEKRDTVTELQGQRPWTYLPAPSNRMRDGLKSDEDLPPMPLPDYNASCKKTSVHTAPSVLLEKRDKNQFSVPNVTNQTKTDIFFY